MKPSCLTPASPKHNHLLAGLSAAEYERLVPYLEPFPLPLGWSVYEADRRITHLLFPTAGIVSLLYVMENGAAAEIALTGNEGAVGISLFMGGESTSSEAVVQCEGHAFRLPAGALKKEFNRGGELQQLLLRFTQAAHANGTDRGVQPASQDRATIVSLAAAQPGPSA